MPDVKAVEQNRAVRSWFPVPARRLEPHGRNTTRQPNSPESVKRMSEGLWASSIRTYLTTDAYDVEKLDDSSSVTSEPRLRGGPYHNVDIGDPG